MSCKAQRSKQTCDLYYLEVYIHTYTSLLYACSARKHPRSVNGRAVGPLAQL